MFSGIYGRCGIRGSFFWELKSLSGEERNRPTFLSDCFRSAMKYLRRSNAFLFVVLDKALRVSYNTVRVLKANREPCACTSI